MEQPQQIEMKDIVMEDLSRQLSEKSKQLAQARAQVMYLQQEVQRLQGESVDSSEQ